jgi:asparagine synthase (glutamine-hydrolysing)
MQPLPMPLRRSAVALLRTLPVEAIARSLRPLMAALPASFATARPADRARFVATLLDARSDWELYRRTLSLGGDAAELLVEPPERPAPLLLDDPRWLAEEPDLQRRMMNANLLCYLPDDILTKVDPGGMAHGLEVREPLLDHRLVEAMLAMPTAMRTAGGVTKPLLRRIAKERLGVALAPQPKMGFAVPLRSWLLGPLRAWSEELLSPASLASDGLLRPDRVAILRAGLERGEHRAAERLWAVLMLGLWRRRWG